MNLKHKRTIDCYVKNHPAASLAFDGCHKIYTLANEAEQEEAEKSGYAIHPIAELVRVFDESCALRFISTWGDLQTIIGQGK